MSILLFLTAILLSGIAAYYSVIGLVTIFSAAAIPVAIMGGSLEVAKLVVASWLYRYWNTIPVLMKTYFTASLFVLMVITSMGIFGFLSKAHSDQSLVSGDAQAKLSLFDEKIKTQRDNIELARKALQQMDAQVDARLARGDSEQGAERAVQIRRQQAGERAKLQKEIADAQKIIAQLNEQRAPIAAENRKVEAEVGPIKYIAALIYGDNPDANLLEKSVRWLIILLICVFDPLAVLMLIAANLTQIKQTELRKQKLLEQQSEPAMDKPNVDTAPVTEPTPEAELPRAAEPPAPVEPVVEQVATVKKKEITKSKNKNNKTKKSKFKKQDQQPVVEQKKIEPERITVKPADTPQPTEPTVQDKLVSEQSEPARKNFEEQVQEMIDNNDNSSLEAVYKKIVKELAKKNRTKSNHWGPLR